MRLSQGQLTLLELCPRKFQHTYLEQLASPTSPEQQERLAAGSQFHALMQQWEMELPIQAFLQEDPQLRRWFNAFVDASPQILAKAAEFRQSEHPRILEIEGHVITVIYDLLLLSDSEAQIIDWKTYPKPRKSDRITQNWQSRLYPFVLAETSDYRPEQISMTYWFFQAQGEAAEPQSLKVKYDTKQHEEIRLDLFTLLNKLKEWSDRYTIGEPFPQVPESAGHCIDCSFALRCERWRDATTQETTDWRSVEEIPL
jgi:PD-(D/E)XK nuclease superfamily